MELRPYPSVRAPVRIAVCEGRTLRMTVRAWALGLLGLAALAGPTMAQDVQAGAAKVAVCAGCHSIPGYRASFPEVHRVPKISGQSAAYIEASLRAYRSGERLHPTMRSVAAALSDQDMADIAAYYEQHGQR